MGVSPTFLLLWARESSGTGSGSWSQQVIEGQGYELVEFELKGGGKNSVLRVFIDKPDGISHQDCELVSEQ